MNDLKPTDNKLPDLQIINSINYLESKETQKEPETQIDQEKNEPENVKHKPENENDEQKEQSL